MYEVGTIIPWFTCEETEAQRLTCGFPARTWPDSVEHCPNCHTTLPQVAQPVPGGTCLEPRPPDVKVWVCVAQRTTRAILENAKWVHIHFQVPSCAERTNELGIVSISVMFFHSYNGQAFERLDLAVQLGFNFITLISAKSYFSYLVWLLKWKILIVI